MSLILKVPTKAIKEEGGFRPHVRSVGSIVGCLTREVCSLGKCGFQEAQSSACGENGEEESGQQGGQRGGGGVLWTINGGEARLSGFWCRGRELHGKTRTANAQ